MGCTTNCANPTWGHLLQQLLYCVLAWFLTTCFSLTVASCKHRFNTDRLRKRLEPAVTFVKTDALYLLASGILAFLLCYLFVVREDTGQIDPTWQLIETLIVLAYALELLLLWLDQSLEGVEKALAFLNGRFIIDATVIPSVVVSSNLDYEGQFTWFSLSFVACFRVFYLWKTYLDSIPSSTNARIQVSNIVITSIVGIFFFGTIIRSIERFAGAPPFAEDSYTSEELEVPRNVWTFLASVYFIFVTTSTVGYGDIVPKTIPGQLFTVAVIMSGIALFSYVCSEMIATYQQSSEGQGSYALKRRARHIVLTGTPSSQMVSDFLTEIYHDDHAKESADLEVVILVSGEGPLFGALRNLLRQKSNTHLKNRVMVLQGSVLKQADLMRVHMYAAATCFVLPNMYVSDQVQDDTENILRVMSIRRGVGSVRIVTLLHKAEHRQLVLTGGVNESDVVCIDEFKMGLLGKACEVVGFSTLVCNLCKTLGEEDTEGMKDWMKHYTSGLGNELYEVELSVTYRRKRFADVVADVLRRSEGAAYLIGVSEEAQRLGDPPALRVNPGSSYQIRDDRRCYGIFMAADRDAIVQQNMSQVNETPQEEAVSKSVGISQPQQVTTQLSKSVFAELIEDQLPNAVPNPVEDNVPGSAHPIWSKYTGDTMRSYEDVLKDRAKTVAAKHIAKRLHQQKILPRGDIEDLLCVTLPPDVEKDPDLIEEGDEEPDAFEEAQAMLRELGPIGQGAVGGAPQLASSSEAQEQSQLHHFEALRQGFVKIRSPKEPPASVLAKGGHILFCTLNSRGETMTKDCTVLGKRLAFGEFLKPLRSSWVHHQRPVVVLAPMIPADWYTSAAFADVYFIQGSPIDSFDLQRTSFEIAHTIVVHQPGTTEGVFDPMMVDSDVIFSARLLESMVESEFPNTGHRPPVIVDLMFDSNHSFVPLQGEGKEAEGAGSLLGLFKSGSMAIDPRQAQGQSVGKFGFQSSGPGLQHSDADRIDQAVTRRASDTGFYKQPRFACGTLFVSSVVTSLVVNTMYSPSLAQLVRELITAHFILVPVPIECHGWTYEKFFVHLMRNRNLISLAMMRKTDAVLPTEDDENIAPPGTSTSGWGKKGPNYRFMQTAPVATTRIVFDDQVLCVPPNTNESAIKNPIPTKRHVGPLV